MKKLFAFVVSLLSPDFGLYCQTFGKETILMETSLGTISLKLYQETPLHRANFIKLVKEGVFDSLLFHRTIDHFMIQGGDPLSKNAGPGDSLGHGDLGYTLPAEFHERLIHMRGCLAAARESDDINPHFESSASQFYIVVGKIRDSLELRKYAARINNNRRLNCKRAFLRKEEGKYLQDLFDRLTRQQQMDSAAMIQAKIDKSINGMCAQISDYQFNSQQVEVYTRLGGTPHLDGTYTVFGEVIEGMEVVDKIVKCKTNGRDRPLTDIRMKIMLKE